MWKSVNNMCVPRCVCLFIFVWCCQLFLAVTDNREEETAHVSNFTCPYQHAVQPPFRLFVLSWAFSLQAQSCTASWLGLFTQSLTHWLSCPTFASQYLSVIYQTCLCVCPCVVFRCLCPWLWWAHRWSLLNRCNRSCLPLSSRPCCSNSRL